MGQRLEARGKGNYRNGETETGRKGESADRVKCGFYHEGHEDARRRKYLVIEKLLF